MKNLTAYEQEQARQKIEKDLDRNTALLEGWKKVTRNYKKDGKPFANLKQNFTGASIHNAAYSMHSQEKEIGITVVTKMSGYQSDYISNSALVKYDGEEFKPTEDRIIKESFLEPYFYLTPDEIETRINKKIAYYEGRIKELNKALEALNKDLETMTNLLEYMAGEISKMSPEAASFFKEKVLRHYY